MTETSWTIRTHGVDYGPYSSREILQLISDGDLGKDDPIIAQPRNRQMQVGDVDVFRDACLAAENTRKERFLEEETESNIRHIRDTQRRRPVLFGILVLLVVGFVYGVIVLRSSERRLARARHLRALTPISASGALGSLQVFAVEEAKEVEEPEATSQDLQKEATQSTPKKKTRRTARRVAKNEKAQEVEKKPNNEPMRFDYTADAIDVDGAEEDEDPGRLFPLSTGEFRAFREIVRSRVKHCQRTQSDGLPSGNYKVLLTLGTDGRIQGARITPETEGSDELVECLRQYTALEKTREFSGQAMTISYPFIWSGAD